MAYSRLLILGATGKAGKCLVSESLARGHAVTALARDPAALDELRHDRLTVVQGDMNDEDGLAALLDRGHDAVLSTLGLFLKEPVTPLADMTARLIRLMEEKGPRRIVVMTSLGVGDSRGQGNLVVQYVTRIVLKHVLRDKELQEQHLADSTLQWSVLRPPRLMNEDISRPYELWQGQPVPAGIKWQISYRDTADIMLDLLNREEAIGQAFQCAWRRGS